MLIGEWRGCQQPDTTAQKKPVSNDRKRAFFIETLPTKQETPSEITQNKLLNH